jgi:hypothetical protein
MLAAVLKSRQWYYNNHEKENLISIPTEATTIYHDINLQGVLFNPHIIPGRENAVISTMILSSSSSLPLTTLIQPHREEDLLYTDNCELSVQIQIDANVITVMA